MAHLQIDSGRVAYREAGAGFPIVLLHGNSSSSRLFLRQLDSNLARRFRVIAPDFPGHGDTSDSADPEATYSIPGLAQATETFLDAAGISECVLVGVSLGGNAGLELASRSDRIAGLMLVGAAPVATPLRLGEAFNLSDEASLTFKGTLSNNERHRLARLLLRGSFDIPDFVVDDVTRTDPRFRSSLANSVNAGAFADETQIVGRLAAPLAVVVGEDEDYVRTDYLRTLDYANLWRGKICEVPRAGHAPHWQAHEAFNALLADFGRDALARRSRRVQRNSDARRAHS